MPEGHTIKRLAIDHAALFGTDSLAVSSPQGRFTQGAALLDGQPIEEIQTHGKHLFYRFPADCILHIHLGLIGKFTQDQGTPPPPVGAVRLRMQSQRGYVDLRGATVVEVITPEQRDVIIQRLGVDPLDPRTRSGDTLVRIRRSALPVGRLLMEQQLIAGVGNVYRAEVLFRASMSPFRPGSRVSPQEWDAIWRDLQRLMREGVRANRIVTTRTSDRSGRLGTNRENWHYVYRRAGVACRVCGAEVLTELMAGRNLFWCPRCQQR